MQQPEFQHSLFAGHRHQQLPAGVIMRPHQRPPGLKAALLPPVEVKDRRRCQQQPPIQQAGGPIEEGPALCLRRGRDLAHQQAHRRRAQTRLVGLQPDHVGQLKATQRDAQR